MDSILPEFILHAGSALKPWFCDFLTSCMYQLKIPKIWRRALIVAIPKPQKPLGDPKSYRPISLLCVPFEILERLICTRVDPIIDPLFLREQAGFSHGRSTVDQVTMLTQNIDDSFSAKKPELCLSTSQQHTTLYGTTATAASCCDCCVIDTWSA